MAKNGIWSKKKIREIDKFDFTSFLVWTFFNFLSHCDLVCVNLYYFFKAYFLTYIGPFFFNVHRHMIIGLDALAIMLIYNIFDYLEKGKIINWSNIRSLTSCFSKKVQAKKLVKSNKWIFLFVKLHFS